MNTSKTLFTTLVIAFFVVSSTMAQAQTPGTIIFWDDFEDDTVGQGPVISGTNIGDAWYNKYAPSASQGWCQVQNTLPAGEGSQYLGVSRISDSGRSQGDTLGADFDGLNPLSISFMVQVDPSNTFGGQLSDPLQGSFNLIFYKDGSVRRYNGSDFIIIAGLSHNIGVWNDVSMVVDYSAAQSFDLTVNDATVTGIPFYGPSSTLDLLQFTSVGNRASPGSIAYFDAVKVMVVPEPATIILLLSGIIGLAAYSWRKR